MKNSVLIILVLMISSLCFSQTEEIEDINFTIAAERFNILYRGLDNPVSISVEGISSENLIVTVNNGASIKRSSKNYIVNVKPDSPPIVDISVSTRIDEEIMLIGTKQFRVKSIPPPQLTVGGAFKDGAEVPKAAILLNPYLSARLDENFEFDGIYFNVTSFELYYQKEGVTNYVTCKGSRFSEEIKSIISSMESGSDLSFSRIMVAGPEGAHQVPGISLKIK